jgi:hypothetical protein
MADVSQGLAATAQKVLDLGHDLANHLNRIVLQASCLLIHAEEKQKKDIEVIRQEGIRAAALVASLQQIGQEIRKLS